MQDQGEMNMDEGNYHVHVISTLSFVLMKLTRMVGESLFNVCNFRI